MSDPVSLPAALTTLFGTGALIVGAGLGTVAALFGYSADSYLWVAFVGCAFMFIGTSKIILDSRGGGDE